MDGIEASGFALSEDHGFDGHNAEARLVDARENLTLKITRYGVGLDDRESAFDSQERILQIRNRLDAVLKLQTKLFFLSGGFFLGYRKHFYDHQADRRNE